MILVIISALAILAFISIVSPELFRVLIPPELMGIMKKAALLPKNIARIINGLVHVPLDTMKAIVVLDAPVADGDGSAEKETADHATTSDGTADKETGNGEEIASQTPPTPPETPPEEPVPDIEDLRQRISNLSYITATWPTEQLTNATINATTEQ
jgi:hypothetical protein